MKATVWSKADVPYHRCGGNEAVSPGSVFSYRRRSTTHRSSTIIRAGWWTIPRNDFDFRLELQRGMLGCVRKTLFNWSRLVIRTGCNTGGFRVYTWRGRDSYARSGSFHGWYHRFFCPLLRAVPFTFRRCARVAFSWAERFAFGLKPVRNWYRSSRVPARKRAPFARHRGTGFSSTGLPAIDRRASKTTRSSRSWLGESRVRSAINYRRLGTMFRYLFLYL